MKHPLLAWESGDYPHGPYIYIARSTTKTDAGEGDVPLNRRALWAIKKLLDRAASLGAFHPEHFLLPTNLAKHTKPTDPLYGRRFDGFDPTIPQKSWNSAWKSLRKAAGLEDTWFYDLRHTAATELGESNVPPSVAKTIMGHENPDMTFYYQHGRMAAKREAVDAVERCNRQLDTLLGISAEEQTVQ